MLGKCPRLKNTIRSKTKSNLNVRPKSEVMVGGPVVCVFVANVSSSADLLPTWYICFFQIELLTLLFLNSLAEEAKTKAFEERSATIRAQHVKAVSKVS